MIVEKGLITDIVFYGDFLLVRPLDELTEALKGCPYRSENVGAVLDRFSLGELFGGIHRDKVLDVLFHIGA